MVRFAFLHDALKAVRPARFLFAVCAASIMTMAPMDPAVAAPKKYAAIVIDANTGETLFSESADSRRYPASLTKMMTLYLTFEALSAGKIRKDSKVSFSAYAASQPPTKIGVRAGATVTVETIIYALVTKSANDAATAMGEFLGGSEAAFAKMMTAKARRLGMKSTVFRNASGLPNTAQFTTARDMATLGIALRQNFPQYYGYFSTRSFTFGKARMPNHNRLLGRIKGVDGIKTGYTNLSGFNLVSSVADGDRRLVAVVMGGTSGASRDNRMAELIKVQLPRASTRRKGPLIALSPRAPITDVQTTALPEQQAPTPLMRPDLDVASQTEAETAQPILSTSPRAEPASQAAEAPAPAQAAERVASAPAAPTRNAPVDPIETASTAPTGWVIQVASSPSEAEARAVLAKTLNQAGAALASALAFTVPFDNNGTTYHRARFGGFASKTAASSACAVLKRKKIDCYAVQG